MTADSPAAPASTRRGRPRIQPTMSTLSPREEILQQSARLFSEKGVAGTRMTDIAAAVGMRAPAVYYYFDNVDAIVETLLTYVVEESAAFATAASRSPGTPRQRLHSLVEQHATRLMTGPYDLWFVVGPSQTSSQEFPRVADKVRAWRRAVAKVISDGAAAGEFRAINSTIAVHAISGLVYGALQAKHEGLAVDPRDVADLAVHSLAPHSTPHHAFNDQHGSAGAQP